MTSPSITQRQSPDPPLQYSLRSLLILQTICAIYFALAVIFKMFSVPIAVGATLIAMRIPVRPENLPLKHFVIDLLGGFFLPVLCLYFDPILFAHNKANTPVQLIALTGITFQMLAFLVWLFSKRQLSRLSGIFGGILLAGVLISFACGLLLLPLSVIGLVAFLIGLAGFTPFITCYVFYRHFSQAKNIAFSISSENWAIFMMLLGLFLAFAIPCLIYLAFGEYLPDIIKHIPWPSGPTNLFGPD
jgi:hypothetical protein